MEATIILDALVNMVYVGIENLRRDCPIARAAAQAFPCELQVQDAKKLTEAIA